MGVCGKFLGRMAVICVSLLLIQGAWAQAWGRTIELIEDDTQLEINARGMTEDLNTIVGFSENGGFTYNKTSDTYTSFADGAYLTRPMDIDDDGTYIVGYKVDEATDPNYEYGFLYTGGVFEARDYPGYRSIINGVNNDGICVGVRMTGTAELASATPPEFHGYLHSGSSTTDLDYPGAEQTVPWDINDSGMVVGYYYEADDAAWHSFTYDSLTDDWNELQADYMSVMIFDFFATSIDDTGDISGYLVTDDTLNGREPVLGYYCGNQPFEDDPHHLGVVYLVSDGYYHFAEVLANTRVFSVTDSQRVLGGCPSFKEGDDSKRCAFIMDPMEREAPSMPTQPDDSTIPISGYTLKSFYIPSFGFETDIPILTALNNNGKVVGSMPVSTTEGYETVPLFWDGVSTSTEEIATGYGEGRATDINDNDTIAGFIGTEEYADGIVFTKDESDPLELEPYLDDIELPPGYFLEKILINNYDEMVIAFTCDYKMPGIFWERGQFSTTAHPFDTPKLNVTQDINQYGRVAANQNQQTFFTVTDNRGIAWDPSLPVSAEFRMSGDEMPWFMAINDSGTICGNILPKVSAGNPYTSSRAMVWEGMGASVVTQTLQAYSSYTYTLAADINNEGTVVGFSYNLDGLNFDAAACIWHRENGAYGTPVLIQDYVPAEYTLFPAPVTAEDWENGVIDSDTRLVSGINGMILDPKNIFINDNGQIVVTARDGDGTPVGLLLTPVEECVEETGGNLDVIGQPYCTNGLLDVPIQIFDAPDAVDALGFEVTFDPELLQFESVITDVDGIDGELLAGFDYWDANLVSPGVVRIGAYTLGSPIPVEASGILAYVRFTALDAQQTQIGLQNLVDDMADWTATSGCLTRADGDINLDGVIRPSDALCALEKASLVCDTTCSPCESTPCDVNMDCDCTASDSVCILNKYLDLPSCLDD